MRLPYAPTTPPTPAAEPIYTRIAARRAPRPLTALDLTLLHAPPLADGWNTFLGAVRTQTDLPPSLLELAICRVAVLNSAVYEWEHHAPLALKAGVSMEGLESVRTAGVGEWEGGKEETREGGLGEREWAVLDYVDGMTRGVKVSDGVFERAKGFLGERGVVEVTVVVGAYNCVSRFLVALDVGERNGAEVERVGGKENVPHA